MQLTRLFADEDAVSPVIGVILMVAITVILAAVIGAFVLGIGSDPATAPQVTMDTDEGMDTQNGTVGYVTFEITSVGGSAPVGDELSAVAGGQTEDFTGSSTLGVGDTLNVTLMGGADPVPSGDEVTIVWSDGDTQQPIANHRLTGDTTGNVSSVSIE